MAIDFEHGDGGSNQRNELGVAEVVPRIARFAIVLARRPPLTLGEIRPPFPPRRDLGACLVQPTMLGVHGGLLSPRSPWPRLSLSGKVNHFQTDGPRARRT